MPRSEGRGVAGDILKELGSQNKGDLELKAQKSKLGFALSGLANFWGRVTRGAAALCPGLSHPGLSGLNRGASIPFSKDLRATVHWQADWRVELSPLPRRLRGK